MRKQWSHLVLVRAHCPDHRTQMLGEVSTCQDPEKMPQKTPQSQSEDLGERRKGALEGNTGTSRGIKIFLI